MRNIIEELVTWVVREQFCQALMFGKVRQEVEKEAIMKNVCIQVGSRNTAQREDSISEDPRQESPT